VVFTIQSATSLPVISYIGLFVSLTDRRVPSPPAPFGHSGNMNVFTSRTILCVKKTKSVNQEKVNASAALLVKLEAITQAHG